MQIIRIFQLQPLQIKMLLNGLEALKAVNFRGMPVVQKRRMERIRKKLTAIPISKRFQLKVKAIQRRRKKRLQKN